MSDLKTKQVFDQPLSAEPLASEELTVQQQFTSSEVFVPVEAKESQEEAEAQLEQVIRPSKGRKWLASGLLVSFSGLVGWQAIDSVITAVQSADWLALGWSGFITALASIGIGSIAKELWKLRSLRHHFSVQEQSELLILSDSVGHGKAFCQAIAKQGGIKTESPLMIVGLIVSTHHTVMPKYSICMTRWCWQSKIKRRLESFLNIQRKRQHWWQLAHWLWPTCCLSHGVILR